MNEHKEFVEFTPPETQARPEGDASVTDLVSRLTSQGAHLAQEQMSLMQAEVREAANDVKTAVAAFATAAIVGMAGLGVTLMGLAYALGDLIESLWLGTLIVGVITLVIAAILLSSAKSKMNASNLKPDRTIRTVKDDPAAMKGDFNQTGGQHGNR